MSTEANAPRRDDLASVARDRTGDRAGDAKRALRAAVRAGLAAMTDADLSRQSALAQERVLALPAWRGARAAACYLPMPREARTAAILAYCARRGIRVCVPCRVSAGGVGYVFCWIDEDTVMRPGVWGILEPERARPVEGASIDVVVAPGVAFDRACGRLGHGGGFYDRLLCGENAREAFRVGLALDVQLVNEVPMEPSDVRMHAVAAPWETVIIKEKERCLH